MTTAVAPNLDQYGSQASLPRKKPFAREQGADRRAHYYHAPHLGFPSVLNLELGQRASGKAHCRRWETFSSSFGLGVPGLTAPSPLEASQGQEGLRARNLVTNWRGLGNYLATTCGTVIWQERKGTHGR